MGPFHRVGENPTLALERDLELVQWLDYLGFDEAWIGEHHSAGWETISSPEIFIGVAADRTKHIKLGTGVISIPYHHPFNVANRMVQLDHMTRGRVMLGVGPGALPGDAYMMGIEPTVQRQRMDEGFGMVLRLMTEDEPITYESDCSPSGRPCCNCAPTPSRTCLSPSRRCSRRLAWRWRASTARRC